MDCNSADPENVTAGFWSIEEIPIGNKGMRSKYGSGYKWMQSNALLKSININPKSLGFYGFSCKLNSSLFLGNKITMVYRIVVQHTKDVM